MSQQRTRSISRPWRFSPTGDAVDSGRDKAVPHRTTLHDVATAAQVSLTTVSNALAGKGKMSSATRERVVAIAAELGYAPNRIASALRHRRTHVIGLVNDAISTSPFAGHELLGAHAAASKAGLVVMTMTTNDEPETEVREFEILRSYQVDGIIYAKLFHQQVVIPPALLTLPSVIMDAAPTTRERPAVVPDEEQIGTTATSYLLNHGHRDIVHLSIEADQPSTRGRREAYEAAMRVAGASPRVVAGEADAQGGYDAAMRALREGPATALFCFNDRMAMGAYAAATTLGLEIPRDLSIVGVDNLELIAAALRPGLTTVRLPHFEMGVWAVEELERQIAGAPLDGVAHEIVTLACPLVERGSVAAPPVRTVRA
jgi:LacI family transcriptional regulator